MRPENDRCTNHECRTPNWRDGIDKPRSGGIGPALIIDGRKRCSCKTHIGERMVPIGEFSINMRNKSGLNAQCKACDNIRRQKHTEKFPRRGWAINTIQNHRTLGYEVEVGFEFLESLANESNNCYICGQELNWDKKGKVVPDSPTLDRMFNGKFIRSDNICIICHKCNRTKGERTMKEFINYCKKVAEKFGGDPP